LKFPELLLKNSHPATNITYNRGVFVNCAEYGSSISWQSI